MNNILDCKWIARHNTVRAHTEAYRIYEKDLGSNEIERFLKLKYFDDLITAMIPI